MFCVFVLCVSCVSDMGQAVKHHKQNIIQYSGFYLCCTVSIWMEHVNLLDSVF